MASKTTAKIFHKYYPREHGAWAILLQQFVLGIVLARSFNMPMALFLVAIIAMYSWVKPFCDIIGRGLMEDLEKRQLRVYLAILTIMAWACMASLIFIYKYVYMLHFGLIGLVIGWISVKTHLDKTEKTFWAETVGMLSLTLCLPGLMYLGTGEIHRTTLGVWAANVLYYFSTILYVRMKNAAIHHRRDPSVFARWRNISVAYHVSMLPLAWGLYAAGMLHPYGWAAFLPVVCKALANVGFPKGKVRLNKVGIAEALYSTAFTLALIVLYLHPQLASLQ